MTGDRIQYPDDAPRLRPDAEYLLVVQDEATEANSRDDPVKELMFRVLSEAEQEVVEAERDAILSLKTLDESSRRLALAIYYATYSPPVEEGAAEGIERRLWGEAWLLLESVAQEQDSPAVHLWMGNVLAATKLPTEAEAAYRSALESADALGDLESQAAAQAGLWRMTENKDRFECALALYEQLGDRRAVRALEEKKER